MTFNDQDMVREVARRLTLIERELTYTPARPADAFQTGLVESSADEYIAAGATGSVNGKDAINATGHPIWVNSQVWLDGAEQYILSTNAANILWGEWDDALTKFNSDSYDFTAANRNYFQDDGFEDIDIYDPAGLLSDISSSEPWVCFATGETNTLTVIGTSAGGSGGGGGGFPWPGPGTDPNPGTATVSIIKATVDATGDADSGDATINFTGGTAIIGTAAATGTFANTFAKAYCDGESVLLISTNGAGWAAIKTHVNIILATVNEGGGVAAADATFDFDGASALEGFPPDGAVGTANNAAGLIWANNEQFWAIQQDDGEWWPIKIPRLNLITATVNNSGGVRPADSTFGFDNGVSITGVAPSGGTGTANNTYTETYADNEVVTLVQRADNGQWEALKKGDSFFVLKGNPSGAITRASSTITCSSPTQVHGKVPVGSITVANSPELKCGTGDTIYFVFDLTAGSTNAARWTTAHPKNHIFILRGYTDYAEVSSEYQVLAHDDAGLMRWLSSTICNPPP